MRRRSRRASVLLLAAAVLAAGCARPWRFRDAEPVLRMDDARPVPVPKPSRFHHALNLTREIVEQPALDALDVTRTPPAGDVNSLDEVPASTWFTPRLGHRPVSPEELLRGPAAVGPPRPPLTVVQAKSGGGNPGFIVADARGERYLLKFDPPEFPAIETTTALVANRLFWGFGYNVPEDFQVFFRTDDLRVPPGGDLPAGDVAAVLAEVAPPREGRYRATASRLLDGIIVGPIDARGVRDDDPNDTIRHEDRRALRGLRVFCAFVNHSDIRPDNSLSVYVGEPGEGHLVHYLLDFGEAFGGHAAERGRLWDGFEHIFSFRTTGRRLVTLGLQVEDWERIRETPWKSVGAFESAVFRPEDWKEATPYAPIRRARPDDDYWAAKILGALTREHVETLVRAAEYPEPGAAEYVVDTLMERREKVLRFALANVSPLEPVAVDSGSLRLRDLWRALLTGGPEPPARYDVRVLDGNGHVLERLEAAAEASTDVVVRSSTLARLPELGYLRVQVTVSRERRDAPPAEFHLRPGPDGSPRLVGVVH
jgi:hypothetical protein